MVLGEGSQMQEDKRGVIACRKTWCGPVPGSPYMWNLQQSGLQEQRVEGGYQEWGGREWGEVGESAKLQFCMMKKFWRLTTQHGDCRRVLPFPCY